MNQAEGTVVAVDRDGRRAVVDVIADVCPRCAEGKGCGAGVFGSTAGNRRMVVGLPPGLRLSAGDSVNLSMAPRNLLRAAGIIYGCPLAGAGAGALLSFAASLHDVAAALSVLAGMVAGMALVRWRLSQRACLGRFMPTVLAHPDTSNPAA